MPYKMQQSVQHYSSGMAHCRPVVIPSLVRPSGLKLALGKPKGCQTRILSTGDSVEGQTASIIPPSPLTPASLNVEETGLVVASTVETNGQNALESLDDMAAFVERTKLEEENIRRKREEVELQLLRMRQQEAVQRQQALNVRQATKSAPASLNIPSVLTPVSPLPPADTSDILTIPTPAQSASPSAGPGCEAGSAAAAPAKKKLVFKKSKRMSAVAAASGWHRVATPPSPSPTTASPGIVGGSSGPLTTSNGNTTGNGIPKALLSREELIKQRSKEGSALLSGSMGPSAGVGGADSECVLDEVVVPKPIFIISDCTGESAARTVRAALNQFEMRCRTQAPAHIMIFRFVESVDKMMSIIQEAAKEDALVVYTLVDPKSVKVVQTACKLLGVRYVDLWTTLLDTMEVHLNAVRSGVPASLAETRKPNAGLTDEYFRMIEAVEYTRKMDDGAHPQEWASADLVILGVSRCGKTPLSIYLGQRGYKVANLPLIPGCPVPKELFEMDQTRIVGLIIDPNVLASIRRNRLNVMGVARAQSIDYAEVKKINSELDWARKLYNAHAEWPVIDVTLRGIEETAARILKMLNDRRGDSSPKWVEAYHAKLQAQSHAAGGPSAGAGAELYNIPEMIYGGNDNTFLMQGLY